MFPTEFITLATTKQNFRFRNLVTLEAKNKGTGEVETIGLWDGGEHKDFTVDSVTMTFYGIGSILSLPQLVSEVGLSVRKHTYSFSSIANEIANVVSLYDLKGYKLKRFLLCLDPETGETLVQPFNVFEGEVTSLSDKRSPEGATLEISCNSFNYKLDKTLPTKKSLETHHLEYPLDSGFQYSKAAGVEITWGEISEEYNKTKPEPPKTSVNLEDLGP